MASLEEWGYGSWTVDCICGVTFDDGKEMVKCDYCNVWVHTRCSHYVKGDDTFKCDNASETLSLPSLLPSFQLIIPQKQSP
ncbi:unnamed protein product [Lupinus luteus]|uniref:PHD-type domain-containing protein n=1 Tax=Lupinus luteus TaxID=3873 RepID=A0AAV1X4V3_LUPLU